MFHAVETGKIKRPVRTVFNMQQSESRISHYAWRFILLCVLGIHDEDKLGDRIVWDE
ncbi:hypothetical protein ACU1JV_22940 [Paenibacillus sp. T2-29]|uniref:hypothetical protein n=1 Tax=Paenibacillus TaxID=44249 RepID=UPI000AB3A024